MCIRDRCADSDCALVVGGDGTLVNLFNFPDHTGYCNPVVDKCEELLSGLPGDSCSADEDCLLFLTCDDNICITADETCKVSIRYTGLLCRSGFKCSSGSCVPDALAEPIVQTGNGERMRPFSKEQNMSCSVALGECGFGLYCDLSFGECKAVAPKRQPVLCSNDAFERSLRQCSDCNGGPNIFTGQLECDVLSAVDPGRSSQGVFAPLECEPKWPNLYDCLQANKCKWGGLSFVKQEKSCARKHCEQPLKDFMNCLYTKSYDYFGITDESYASIDPLWRYGGILAAAPSSFALAVADDPYLARVSFAGNAYIQIAPEEWFELELVSIEERDGADLVSKVTVPPASRWQNETSGSNTVTLNTVLANGVNLTILFDYYNSDTTIEFGGISKTIPAGTLKSTITLSPWPFQAPLNNLEFRFRYDSSSHSILQSDLPSDYQFFRDLSTSDNSQLIHRSPRDCDVVHSVGAVKVGFLEPSAQTVPLQMVADTKDRIVAIVVQPYAANETLIIDPDVSVLLGGGDSSGDGSDGGDGGDGDDSTVWIIIIVVVVVLALIIVCVAIIIIFIMATLKSRNMKKKLRAMSAGASSDAL
eukprot:TRINITY_DN365_c0_g1_i1.p1 TRINITY_DN365_c0_g1~~TRINITY_DN365_c0_g1_i1.p1  ORF type:complete len:589 (+),score=49.89 TRINITY_DN365_c0_g1_i1:37-1803(+)